MRDWGELGKGGEGQKLLFCRLALEFIFEVLRGVVLGGQAITFQLEDSKCHGFASEIQQGNDN